MQKQAHAITKRMPYCSLVIRVQRLTGPEARQHLKALAAVLTDCVEGGASVSFTAPLSNSDAESFFAKAIEDVEQGNRILLAAFSNNELVGTVQVVTAMPPNQPHRAEIAKLLVRRDARGQGIAGQLMGEAEEAARLTGKTLLTLDTASADAEKVYTRMGWTRVGIIPNYALLPDGTPCATTIFWKSLL